MAYKPKGGDLSVQKRKIIVDCDWLTKWPDYVNECHFAKTRSFHNGLGKMLLNMHVGSTLTANSYDYH